MSALKIIEKAALSLPGEEQRQLLVFMTTVVENAAQRGEIARPPGPQFPDGLHPALVPMVGIIPPDAAADDIHGYRLLKHA